jgi:hypothetical protein
VNVVQDPRVARVVTRRSLRALLERSARIRSILRRCFGHIDATLDVRLHAAIPGEAL